MSGKERETRADRLRNSDRVRVLKLQKLIESLDPSLKPVAQELLQYSIATLKNEGAPIKASHRASPEILQEAERFLSIDTTTKLEEKIRDHLASQHDLAEKIKAYRLQERATGIQSAKESKIESKATLEALLPKILQEIEETYGTHADVTIQALLYLNTHPIDDVNATLKTVITDMLNQLQQVSKINILKDLANFQIHILDSINSEKKPGEAAQPWVKVIKNILLDEQTLRLLWALEEYQELFFSKTPEEFLTHLNKETLNLISAELLENISPEATWKELAKELLQNAVKMLSNPHESQKNKAQAVSLLSAKSTEDLVEIIKQQASPTQIQTLVTSVEKSLKENRDYRESPLSALIDSTLSLIKHSNQNISLFFSNSFDEFAQKALLLQPEKMGELVSWLKIQYPSEGSNQHLDSLLKTYQEARLLQANNTNTNQTELEDLDPLVLQSWGVVSPKSTCERAAQQIVKIITAKSNEEAQKFINENLDFEANIFASKAGEGRLEDTPKNRQQETSKIQKNIKNHIQKLTKKAEHNPNHAHLIQPKIDFLTSVKDSIDQYIKTGRPQTMPVSNPNITDKIHVHWFTKIITAITNALPKVFGKSSTANLIDGIKRNPKMATIFAPVKENLSRNNSQQSLGGASEHKEP